MSRIDVMLVGRVAAIGSGVVLAAYGAVRLLTDVPGSSLLRLAVWLVGALVISDLVVSPLVVAIGVRCCAGGCPIAADGTCRPS